MPRVGVLIPHYCAEEYLAEAVESVLRQDCRDLEVHVADDASPTERWLSVLAPLRRDPRLILWRSNRNVGPYRIKNVLLARTDTPVIALQDADDRSHPQRLSRQLGFMDATGADLVGCWTRYINPEGRVYSIGPVLPNINFWLRVGLPTTIRHPTAIMRRSIFEVLRGFDGSTKFGADQEFILRAAYLHKLRNLARPLYDLRQTGGSLSRSEATGMRSEARQRYWARYRAEEQLRRQTTDRARLLELLVPPENDLEFALERVD
ncbi:MAG: glycosyltransferase family 2 protein [Nannocystis sp.]|nr:glycosyltransferase family 2 protein [Nannocystis sp.]MBA3544860.1 glycosyltransferase family 2 protein [Nannocystis sp.]